MSQLDAVLERLATDAAFETALSQDPTSALADYDLTLDELELLADVLTGDAGQHEARMSKAAFVALFSG